MSRIVLLLTLLLTLPAFGAEPVVRTFRITYEVTVGDLKPSQEIRLWLPIPPTSDDQKLLETRTTFPVKAEISTEQKFGNSMYFLTPSATKDGTINVRVVYTIQRNEVRGETDKTAKADLALLVKPDSLAPTDGKHLKLLEGKKLPADPVALGQTMYDLVNGMMRYSKEGTEWGRGDVNWVCDSKFGNCTDFHSLFIALMRSQRVPAKFEIGFPLPEKRGQGAIAGYHCWAKFKTTSQGWLPVDISEANKNPSRKDYYFGNLTADRVTFSTGRDVFLEPKQAGPPLNFFVYPYAEADGKPIPSVKLKSRFAFEDVEGK